MTGLGTRRVRHMLSDKVINEEPNNRKRALSHVMTRHLQTHSPLRRPHYFGIVCMRACLPCVPAEAVQPITSMRTGSGTLVTDKIVTLSTPGIKPGYPASPDTAAALTPPVPLPTPSAVRPTLPGSYTYSMGVTTHGVVRVIKSSSSILYVSFLGSTAFKWRASVTPGLS